MSVVGNRSAPLVRTNSPHFLRRGLLNFLSLKETKEHIYFEKQDFDSILLSNWARRVSLLDLRRKLI